MWNTIGKIKQLLKGIKAAETANETVILKSGIAYSGKIIGLVMQVKGVKVVVPIEDVANYQIERKPLPEFNN